MEREFTIKEGKYKLTVAVSQATFVKIIDANRSDIAGAEGEKLTGPQIFFLPPGKYQVVSDGEIESLKTEAKKETIQEGPLRLALNSDAKDFHVVDGVGEIAADGKSFTTVTAQVTSLEGEPLTKTTLNGEVFVRTNAGFVKDVQGKEEIRQVKLKKGKAQFRLYSENHKRLATIQVISSDPKIEAGSISVEFF